MKFLNIFYASQNSPNEYINSSLWRSNLLLALRDLGHSVYEYEYDWGDTFKNLDKSDPIQAEFIKKFRPKHSEALVKKIKEVNFEKKIDVFFSYFYDACVLPEAIDEIHSLGINTINWYCNGSYQLNLVEEISPHYDYCLVPEEFRLEDYRKLGANPIYFQEAANPNIYKSYPVDSFYDVTFIGQNYGNRAEYIRYLNQRGVSVKVFGPGWRPKIFERTNLLNSGKNFFERLKLGKDGLQEIRKLPNLFHISQEKKIPDGLLGGVLSDEEMIKMYSCSKINLGFSVVGETHLTDRPIHQVRLRDFEVPMSGGFYLVEYLPELEKFYEIGKEIVCFNGKEDLLEKIRYYLSHPEEREQIRLAGYGRAQQDHTWQKRFSDLFEAIYIKD